MAHQLFQLPKPTAISNNLTLVAGAKVGFFLTQTVTPTNTYQDAALTTPHTNPVVADAAGRLPPIYLNPDILYRVTFTDSADVEIYPAVDPVNDRILSQAIIGSYLYPSTAAEIAAGVTPTTLSYPEGCAFRYMTSAQIVDVISGALAVDVTAALQILFNISDDGVDCYLPPGKYFVSDSLTKSDSKNFRIRGAGRRTVIVNKASASKPSIKLTDIHYARLEDFVISGRTGFPNTGLLIDATGSGLNGNFELRNLSMEPNGNGIEVRMANTIELTNFEYWPSGGLGVGSSQDAGNRKHGFYVDGTIAGNYCNDILMSRPNIIGVDQTISGHALIKIGTDQISGIQGVTILQGELEGSSQKVEITNVSNLLILGGYYDDADIVLDNVRYGTINGAYNADLISMASCVHVMLSNLAQGDAPSSFVIDSGCTGCGADNVDFANAPTVSNSTSVFRNWSILGVRQRDIGYSPWIAAPTFAAGDYTATTGTWTVGSGDVANMRSHLDVGSKKLVVTFDLVTTTTASSPTALHIKIPGGYTAGAATTWFLYTYSEDNGTTNVVGQGRVIAGSTNITLYKLDLATAFANVTNLLLVRGQCEIEIA